jgi:penicillin-binding protein 1A
VRVNKLISNYLTRWSTLSVGRRILHGVLALGAVFGIAIAALLAYALIGLAPTLPSVDALADYRPKEPLRVYTADNVLIGEFGDERREFVAIADIPKSMQQAVIAIEDDRFYEHGGVDLVGIVRAGIANLRSARSQGASTITMQVARTFFLTRKKTYTRKLQEIMLAYRIEQKLTKDQILELYMNQIYLGNRSYGFGTAARVYFGKTLDQLTVAETAMLAGLPQAPGAANPVVNPKRAKQRQRQVLKRMRDLGYITEAQHAKASEEPIKVVPSGKRFGTYAEHAAELVRQLMFAQYKEETYTRGISVYTTLTKADQDAAYEAVRRGVLDYDRRHGYRGPEAFVDLPGDAEERQQVIDETLLQHPDSDDLRSAVVLSATPKQVRAAMLSGEEITITGEGLRFAASALAAKARDKIRLRPGSIIRIVQDSKEKWSITQLPEVAAAFVALDAQDGAFRAMVGGFDFGINQFDHVTQAWRQPGSTFKPFIYSAALEKGLSPSTMINDAPLAIESNNGSPAWEPQNDDGSFDGPVTMRTGLTRSKNLVSIRILQTITPQYALDYITRFGFDAERHPGNLTMTLGTGAVTPLQMAGAYTAFANGGYLTSPYLISKVVDARGNLLSEAVPVRAGDQAARVLDPRNAFVVDSMLRDVVRSGTAYSASQKLRRNDLAGKTGTTNDALDGWFAGYGGNIVAVAWMGFDNPRSLGNREFGSTLALPIWINYMRTALRGKPEVQMPVPAGLVQANGDWMYQEYLKANAVESVGIERPKGFWERLFGGSPIFGNPPPPPSREDEEEKKRMQEIYGYGG